MIKTQIEYVCMYRYCIGMCRVVLVSFSLFFIDAAILLAWENFSGPLSIYSDTKLQFSNNDKKAGIF